MNILAEVTKKHLKKNVPDLKIGDTIRVHQKIRDIDAKGKDRERIQIFEGIVIARKHGNGIEGTFTVRKIAAGSIGVERVYPLHSPNVVKIERLKSADVNQSKLYYLRDLRASQMRLRKETANKTVWEEKGAEEEIEAIKAETAEAAEEAAEEKADEEVTEAPVEEVKTEEQPETPAETKEEAPETPAETEEKN
jgi:large subunit ribosomal protein L19